MKIIVSAIEHNILMKYFKEILDFLEILLSTYFRMTIPQKVHLK